MMATSVLAVLLLAALAGAQQSSPWIPQQVVPSFSVTLLNGSSYSYNAQAPGIPVLIMALNDEEPFTSYMWQNDDSVKDFLRFSPNNTIYLFMNHNTSDDNASQRMTQLRSEIIQHMQELDFSAAQMAARLDQFCFAAIAVSSHPTLSQLLTQWVSPFNQVEAVASNPHRLNVSFARFDCHYTFCSWPTSGQSGPLVLGANGCQALPDLTNQYVLLFTTHECDVYTMANNVQNANANGVIFAAEPGQSLYEIGNNNISGVNPIVTLVPYTAGVDMRETLQNFTVNITFVTNNSPGIFAGIDSAGKLVELGWEKYCSLMFLVYEAQWLNYEAELFRNLSLPALVIPILDRVDMQGTLGAVGHMDLDPDVFNALRKHEIFELEAALTCPGSMDVDCGIWDYIVELNLCCYDDQYGNPGSSEEFCGAELGRWITPFRRRIGRWLTPVNQLLPLITSTNCTFVMTDPSWSAPWISSLNLRFRNPTPKPVLPVALQPLFQGGWFNSSYNDRAPIKFTIPEDTALVQLEAVITGHGSDDNGCCEFAVTSHHFIVNGNPFVVTFAEAGDEFGCANKVPEGVEPNEHGTWYYGRNGWCDGQDVRPWVVDITDVVFTNQTNEIVYYAMQDNFFPNLTSTSGNIVMESNLVLYDSV
eukprot:m.281376 g.281376  ORF g.281376 m.281376 type:complete len:646 (+) comp54929_c0_seq2:1304-3241(+)